MPDGYSSARPATTASSTGPVFPEPKSHGAGIILFVFEFDYRLTGSGWSEARVADEQTHAILTASYLSDALGGLLEAVALTLEGSRETRCSWDEEPGEFRWIFRRKGAAVDLQILVFPELWSDAPDEEGEEAFRTEQLAVRVGRAILAEAQRLFDEHGEEGYSRQWVEHPFPTGALARLRRAVKTAAQA